MHELTEEMRKEIEAERARRDLPQTALVLEECLRSTNPRVVKVATLYEKGMLTLAEFESKVREVLGEAP